jgi:PadR family transcriptional regulator, regulatory protein AphA
MPTRTAAPPRTLTTTEAAVLALLAIEGERSAYDLLKFVGGAIGYVWAPARSQLYALLPRLARDGLARQRKLAQSDRPDKQLYRITREGRRALRAWLAAVEPGAVEPFMLRLFVGGLMPRAQVAAHVEQFRRDTEEQLEEYRRIEPTNSRTGHDEFHYFLLRRAIERAEHDLEWADWVLAELG